MSSTSHLDMFGPCGATRRLTTHARQNRTILDSSGHRRLPAALPAIRPTVHIPGPRNRVRLCGCEAICARPRRRPMRSLRLHPDQRSLTKRRDHRIAGANVSNILPSLVSLAFDQCALSAVAVRILAHAFKFEPRHSNTRLQSTRYEFVFVANLGLCQDHNMKHLLLACLLPMTLTAQTMQQLTEQLGKTVLYGDIALSPDGEQVAWVQSTAASTSKQTFVRETSGNVPAILIKIPISGERTEFDPAWAPDSKTLAVFSGAGEGAQRQLWSVKADGSDTKRLTNLNGYAARPRWSHDGKQIAFLYIEGASGGGPLTAAPMTTGVIDPAIHSQRIAVLDVANGQLRQVSPENLHIYDYDWSPDDKTFVTTAAPGPGDNNWWIAQIYTINVTNGNATSIHKPSLQVAVPRWSPDGKSIAFIEGLMSDEGFHGGDLFTISASGADVQNRTNGRKSSVSSLFWLTPDRILFTEIVGGGGAISELNIDNNSVRTIWKGAEALHAFGNFPDFAISKDGKFAVAERSTFETPPEIWVGPIGEWRQLTNSSSALSAMWGKAESIEWAIEGFNIQGWLLTPSGSREPGKKHPMVVLIHGGPSSTVTPDWPAGFGMSRAIIAALSARGYYVLIPNPRGSYGQGEEFTRANVKDFGADRKSTRLNSSHSQISYAV